MIVKSGGKVSAGYGCALFFVFLIGLGPFASADVYDEATVQEKASSWFDKFHEQLTYEAFEVHPHLGAEYVLDSNVLLESGDEKLDSIFRQEPGAEIIIPIQDHYLKADYRAEIEEFTKFERENDQNQYFESEASFNFTDLYAHADQGIVQTSSRSGTTFTERIPRFEHKVDSIVGYKFNKVTLEAGYNNFYRSYDTTSLKNLNYQAHEFSGRAFVDATPKSKAFMEYAFTDYNYMKDATGTRDGVGNEVYVGVKGAVLPRTTLYSKFGYEQVRHDESDDAHNFAADVGVDYNLRPGTGANLGWTRSVEQSTYSTTSFFTQDILFLVLYQRMSEKLTGKVVLSYANQDYEEKATAGPGIFTDRERNDDLFSSGVTLTYEVNEWVNTDIAYQYNRRDSNASVFDYTDHVMVVGLSMEV